MCSILDQRTAIVDDRLFFCSGNYTFDDDGLTRHTTSSIYWINLNETIDVRGPIDLELLGSTSLPSPSLSGGRVPDIGGSAGTFFYDHTMLYAYAGLVGPEADGITNELYAFNTTDNSWNLTQIEGDSLSFGSNSEGVYANDPRTATSFYTGGWTMAYNGTSNGTVKFQSDNTHRPSWTFHTGFTGFQGPDILKGAMVYVRKGRAGILVAFGGYQTAYQGTQIPGWPWDQRPFSDIFIYDIYFDSWYRQTATGDIPELRTEFCAVVSAAPDDSSFQITIHGGWDQLNSRAFNDVYVLSIPSFRWIKVQDSNNPDLKGPDQTGRARHKCDIWNETSMLVSGGDVTVALGGGYTNLLTNTCNTAYPPIKVLDTSTYIWQTEFNPSSTYSVPVVVSAVIGGGSSGGAQLTAPENGWDSQALVDIFNQTIMRDTYTPPGRQNPMTATSPEAPSNSHGDSSDGGNPDESTPAKDKYNNDITTGAIVGIAIGAAAVTAGIFSVLVFCRRGRKKEIQVIEGSTSSSISDIWLFKGWHKPELDATTAQRYEVDAANNVHEVHGDNMGKREHTVEYRNIGEFPISLTAR